AAAVQVDDGVAGPGLEHADVERTRSHPPLAEAHTLTPFQCASGKARDGRPKPGSGVPGQPSRPLDGADGLVEDALAALEQRDRLAEAVLLEVRGLAVRAVGLLVVVDLVEEEDAGILEVPVGLIEATARLGPRGLDQLSHRGE